jgi:hypothetical protein
MRLFELVDSDQELLELIKPILIRAKAEGAKSIDMQQLINDMGKDNNISPEFMVDILNRHREQLKNLITKADVDNVIVNNGQQTKSMTTKHDQDAKKMKDTALKQALGGLKL